MRDDAAGKKHIFRLFGMLRFMLIVMVVYNHNVSLDIKFNGFSIGASEPFFLRDYIISMISQGWGRVAVPLFNFISGYLFFFGVEWSLAVYGNKLRARLRTLGIPFLFWNTAVFCLFAALQALPFTAVFFNNAHASVLTFSPFGAVDAILGITGEPIAYQFWFIRDLLMMIFLSPILHVVLRVAGVPFILVLGGFWLTDSWPFLCPSIRSILFFSIGAALSMRNIKPIFPNPKAVLLATGIAGTFVFTISALYFDKFQSFDPAHGDIFFKVGLVIALFFNLALGDIIARSSGFISKSLHELQRASFFVFATHEPLLTMVRKIVFRFFPMNPVLSLVYYLLLPLFVVTVTTILYFALERAFPKFTSLVTGGRSAERNQTLLARGGPATEQSAS